MCAKHTLAEIAQKGDVWVPLDNGRDGALVLAQGDDAPPPGHNVHPRALLVLLSTVHGRRRGDCELQKI